jgi:cytoskeletal protein CcmA (bactofilin family)
MAGGDVEDKLRTGDSVTVDAGEVVAHDLYVFGGDVVVDGTVEGDLVVASSSVTINGLVQGDVVAGAGQLIVNGEVDGDVRVGAGRITLTGSVGEDLLAGAGQIDVAADGSVGEDLIFGAGDVTMRGVVAGSVYGSATTYSSRNGSVGGSENVTLDTGFEPSEPALSEPVRIAADALRQLLTVVLFGAVGLWLVPGALRASESALRRRPLASVGMGIGILVGYIIQFIAVILLMILVGVALGSVSLDGLAGIAIWAGIVDLMISTLALVVAASFVVDAVVGLALAQLVARGWAQSRWQELFLLVVGALIVVAVTSLPEIGGIVKLCVIVLGLGAMTVAAAEAWQRRHPPAAPSWGAQAAAPTPPATG